MQLKMSVSFTDGTTKECVAVFADFVAFERTWSRSVTKFESDMRLTDIAWLAYKTEIRNRYTTAQFDDWLLLVDSIDVVDDSTDDQTQQENAGTDPLV